MEIRYLRSFLVLANELHFTRAAAKLNLTQPTLSNQINAIEAYVGARVIDRTSRRVELTPEGRALESIAVGVVAEFDRGVELVREIANGAEGVLRIGYCSASMAKLLANVLRDYRLAHPHVTLNIEQMGTNASIAALRTQRIDVAFFHPPTEVDGLEAYEIDSDPIVLAIESGVVGAERSDSEDELPPIRLADVAELPLVIYPREMGPHLYDRIIGAYAAQEITPQIQQNVSLFTSAAEIVASGGGVAFLPKALGFSCPPQVELRSIVGPTITITYGVAVNPSNTNPCARSFVDRVYETTRTRTRIE